jgi:hypothetical protein
MSAIAEPTTRIAKLSNATAAPWASASSLVNKMDHHSQQTGHDVSDEEMKKGTVAR